MKGLKLVAIIAVLIAIGGGLWAYWRYSTIYPSTQDAYVRANVVTIATEVTGKVIAVHVVENQRVAAGDPLFDLDDAVYKNAVTQAKAQVESASEATGSYGRQIEAASAAVESAMVANNTAQAQLVRVQALFDDGNTAQASLDQARSAAAQSASGLRAAQAQLAQARAALVANRDALVSAQAALQTAELNLERTKVVAPVDGWVSNIALREGTVVTAYAPLFSMVDSGEWWVEANFKESDLPRIKEGQPVTISVDMLPGTTLKGKVNSIAYGSGSTFALLPAENASGNWVKVTQRFPVRITFDGTDPGLRVGASTSVRIDTTGGTK
jgi:membrane fusion protein (multidrug efflux system)